VTDEPEIYENPDIPMTGSVVKYTVKELLQDIRLSIERLDTKLDTKADKSDVAVLVTRVDVHDKRLDGHQFRLDEKDRDKRNDTDSRRFKIPLIVSIAFNLVGPFFWLAVSHIH
jgi:hypothetical protein